MSGGKSGGGGAHRWRVGVRGGVAAALLAVLGAGSGCSSALPVYSQPAGAHVLMNGRDTGRTTPASFRVRHLPLGRSVVTVAKEGCSFVPKQQEVDVRVSVGNIVWSWFPPVLIKNLAGNMWKGVTNPRNRRLATFELEGTPGAAAREAETAAKPRAERAAKAKAAKPAVQEAPPPPPPQEKPATAALDNDDILRMIKSGMSDDAIVATIQKGPSAFDTSPQALAELKKQGVAPGILSAMAPAPQPAPPAP